MMRHFYCLLKMLMFRYVEVFVTVDYLIIWLNEVFRYILRDVN